MFFFIFPIKLILNIPITYLKNILFNGFLVYNNHYEFAEYRKYFQKKIRYIYKELRIYV